MKRVNLKKALYYFLSLIVLLVYIGLMSVLYQNISKNNGALCTPIMLFLIFPVLLYCISGLMAGLLLHLIPEIKKSGKWQVNWCRLIVFSGILAIILACAELYYFTEHLNFFTPVYNLLFYRLKMQGILNFLFGFSVMTCFYKKTSPAPAEAEAEEKAE